MNDELEKIKKNGLYLITVLSQDRPEGTQESHERHKIAVPAWIRTEYLMNTNQDFYRYADLLGTNY
jgi:hypothetical protein